MRKVYKYVGVGAVAAAFFSGCGDSGSTSSSSPTSSGSAGASSVGTFYGSTTSSLNAQVMSSGASVKTLPAASGTAYYIPIYNLASSGNLTITAEAITNSGNTTVWTTDTSVPSSCQNIVPGGSCIVSVGFNAANVESPAQLASVLTVTYSNGTTSSIPLAGNVVESGNGIFVSSPSTIVVNESGYGGGIITVYNSDNESKTISASTIAVNSQQGVTWEFSPNCDGSGGGTIAPQSACSVAYIYGVDTSVATPGPVTVTIPVTNADGTVTNVTTPAAQQAPVPSASNPAPFLVYTTGASVFVPESGSANVIVQNLGNAVLSSVTTSSSESHHVTADASACSNLAVGAVCNVSVTQSSSFHSAIITLTPSSGSAVEVPVVGQTLAVAPASLSFGTSNYGGTVLSKTVTVSNLGSSALSDFSVGSTLESAYSITSNTCPSGSLAAFNSCVVTVKYTAPNESATESGIITVAAESSTNHELEVAISAGSLQSGFTNQIASAPSDYAVYPVLSMAYSDTAMSLYFGVSPAQGSGVTGYKNVWSIESNGTYTNLTQGLSTYIPSAPTALLMADADGSMFYVGHYDGAIQLCNIATSACTDWVAANESGLGVTSMVIAQNVGFASYSDKTTGASGEVLVCASESSHIPATGITSAVGKMATDGTVVYAPLSNGQLVMIQSSESVSSSIAPSSLQSGEYPTVAYVTSDESSLYIGTSLGNVYQSNASLPALTTSSTWNLLTPTQLSTQSFVSSLGLDSSNNLYAGLVNLSTPSTGGGLFVLESGASSFVAATGYADTSSVSAILSGTVGTAISTYAGNIWTTAN